MSMTLIAQEPQPKMEPTAPPIAQLFPFVIIIGGFILMTVLSGRRQKRDAQNLLNNLKLHDKVVTHSGILGSVVNIADTEVTLKVDETTNSRMRVLKSAIASVVKIADEPKEAK